MSSIEGGEGGETQKAKVFTVVNETKLRLLEGCWTACW